MCGIAGATNGLESSVHLMLEKIKHRGPDGIGVRNHGGFVHGHVRLSLVDLSELSSQPFVRNGSTLTFNGEIWNHRELKLMLAESGEKFATTGDTEVLAAMLGRHGMDCLPMLDGMFAFAWTPSKGDSWLVRDSFGKVPVYVAKHNGGYLWASERKAFPAGVKAISVPAGFAFNLTTGEWRKWYSMPSVERCTHGDVLGRLRDGVAKRLSADAPVCCLISGGLDSSIILGLAVETGREVVAFTASFDQRSNDLLCARRLCSDLGVKLFEVPVGITDRGIAEAMESIEIPSKAQIEIAVLCVPLAKRIAAEGFKACLSGEAADELFGGYGNFCIQASRETDDGVIRLRLEQLAKMSRGNFVRCNKAFMAGGVECRLPFMEQRLVESAVQLTKSESPPGKKLLKLAAESILPKWIINRPKDTFQGASGVADEIARRIASPTKFYNSELRKRFGYLPED